MPLQTSTGIRVTTQFQRGEAPAASLAAWVHVVLSTPCDTPSSSCETVGCALKSAHTVLGYLSLTNLCSTNSHLVISTNSVKLPLLFDTPEQPVAPHLRYAGHNGVPLSSEPQLVEVSLVRICDAALSQVTTSSTCCHKTISSRNQNTSCLREKNHLVTGTAELKPGDLLGVVSTPLLRVPVGTLCQRPPPPPW